MESLDSRIKRIEQRLASIEKYIAENISPNKNRDLSTKLGRTSEAVEVASEYRYDYSADIDRSKAVKAQIHQVDTSLFNNVSRSIIVPDDALNTAVFGSILILALFFIGRVLVDSSWMSQVSQIALGTLVSLGFVAAGYFLADKLGVYAKYFPIVGMVGLNITIFGASNFYAVIPKNLALVGAFLTSVVGLLQFSRFKMQVYSILAVMGAYLLPLYISFQSNSVFTNFYYLFVSLFFMIISVWKGWHQLAIMAAYFSLSVCAMSEYMDNDIINEVKFTLGHFVIFAAAYTLSALRSKEGLNKVYSYCFFPFVLLFYVAEYYYIDSTLSKWSPIFTALTSLLLFVCYLTLKNFADELKHELTSNLLLSSAGITLVHTIFYVMIPAKFRPIALVLAGFGLFKGLEQLPAEKYKEFSKIFMFFIMIVIGWNYFEVMFSQFSARSNLPYIDGAIYMVVLLYITMFEKTVVHTKINPLAVVTFVHLMAVSTVYNLTKQNPVAVWGLSVTLYLVIGGAGTFFLHLKTKND